ncbi:MAG: GNAT family N-acetyltransferase [Asticcacaulis sp.]
MTEFQSIMTLSPETVAGLLALNNRFARETSWLSEDEWTQMLSGAFATFAADTQGFLLAFDQDAVYDSRNFLWFRSRFERFVYIDRVVIDPAAQGQGLGRRFYEALAKVARDAGHDRIVCEVNTVPDNPASHRFHERLGFAAIADVEWQAGQKAVRYYEWGL